MCLVASRMMRTTTKKPQRDFCRGPDRPEQPQGPYMLVLVKHALILPYARVIFVDSMTVYRSVSRMWIE